MLKLLLKACGLLAIIGLLITFSLACSAATGLAFGVGFWTSLEVFEWMRELVTGVQSYPC